MPALNNKKKRETAISKTLNEGPEKTMYSSDGINTETGKATCNYITIISCRTKISQVLIRKKWDNAPVKCIQQSLNCLKAFAKVQ